MCYIEVVLPQRDSCVDECEGCGVDAGAVVAAVGLQHLDEHVDLRPRVKLGADLEFQKKEHENFPLQTVLVELSRYQIVTVADNHLPLVIKLAEIALAVQEML